VLGEVVVHTTGVNWDGVLANVASITVILGVFGAVIIRSIKRSIKDEVSDVVATQVTPLLTKIQARLDGHDTRLARLEGVEEGKRQAIAQAGVTTVPPAGT
jgi:predicted nucleic acid-binding protein